MNVCIYLNDESVLNGGCVRVQMFCLIFYLQFLLNGQWLYPYFSFNRIETRGKQIKSKKIHVQKAPQFINIIRYSIMDITNVFIKFDTRLDELI